MRFFRHMTSYVDQSSSDKQVKSSLNMYQHSFSNNCAFQKSYDSSTKLSIRDDKKTSEKDDISTETQTARWDHDDVQFNVNVERASEKESSSSKHGKSRKNSFQDTEQGIEAEDALNLMFNYFDKRFGSMQAQLNNKMEPPIKKYKKPDRQDIEKKGNNDSFEFKAETAFIVQECQQQRSNGNIEDMYTNLTSISAKVKKRIG